MAELGKESEKDKIQKIINVACSSREEEIGKEYLREVKKFISKTQDFDFIFECAMKQLKKNDANIRFSAWQLLAYLFPRSNKIR